jgi:hypothetical protein
MEWDIDEGPANGWSPTSNPEFIEYRWKWAVEKIRAVLPNATEDEVLAISRLMLAAMDHADEDAFVNDRYQQTKRSGKAVSARRAKAQDKRHEILAAFHTAARVGREIDVDEIARQCKCGRSTVYRALTRRPSGGSDRSHG